MAVTVYSLHAHMLRIFTTIFPISNERFTTTFKNARVFVRLIHSRFSSVRLLFSLEDFVIAIRSENCEKCEKLIRNGHKHIKLGGESG